MKLLAMTAILLSTIKFDPSGHIIIGDGTTTNPVTQFNQEIDSMAQYTFNMSSPHNYELSLTGAIGSSNRYKTLLSQLAGLTKDDKLTITLANNEGGSGEGERAITDILDHIPSVKKGIIIGEVASASALIACHLDSLNVNQGSLMYHSGSIIFEPGASFSFIKHTVINDEETLRQQFKYCVDRNILTPVQVDSMINDDAQIYITAEQYNKTHTNVK